MRLDLGEDIAAVGHDHEGLEKAVENARGVPWRDGAWRLDRVQLLQAVTGVGAEQETMLSWPPGRLKRMDR